MREKGQAEVRPVLDKYSKELGESLVQGCRPSWRKCAIGSRRRRASGRAALGLRAYFLNFARSRAIAWLCIWQTRLSVTPSTAPISLRFISCS